MNTASAVFHLRAGIPVFYLFLGPVIILSSAWMAVREAGQAIRTRTCAPLAWAGFAVLSIAVLLGVAGLNLRLAAYAGIPALGFTAAMGLITRHGHSRTRRQADAQERLNRPADRRN